MGIVGSIYSGVLGYLPDYILSGYPESIYSVRHPGTYPSIYYGVPGYLLEDI